MIPHAVDWGPVRLVVDKVELRMDGVAALVPVVRIFRLKTSVKRGKSQRTNEISTIPGTKRV